MCSSMNYEMRWLGVLIEMEMMEGKRIWKVNNLADGVKKDLLQMHP